MICGGYPLHNMRKKRKKMRGDQKMEHNIKEWVQCFHLLKLHSFFKFGVGMITHLYQPIFNVHSHLLLSENLGGILGGSQC